MKQNLLKTIARSLNLLIISVVISTSSACDYNPQPEECLIYNSAAKYFSNQLKREHSMEAENNVIANINNEISEQPNTVTKIDAFSLYTNSPDHISSLKECNIESLTRVKFIDEIRKYSNTARFSKVVISPDGLKSVVEFSIHCGGLCGSGHRFILNKDNDQWNVQSFENTWIS